MSLLRPRPRSPRRGVTLVEMLVAVALLVLMMSVLVTIFTAATGAVSGLRTFQELDGNLRQLDSVLRQDLQGITARMTPPLDPKYNLGYFEYGENSFADLQGEDTDDYIRFTAKAPEGQLFTGRVWVANPPLAAPPTTGISNPNSPILVTSQYAEIIYFLRNGNLYRRVLLVAPERQSSIYNFATTTNNAAGNPAMLFNDNILGSLVSWQSVNDLSAHPSALGSASASNTPILLNTLGDLTNRENRIFYPRFVNDLVLNTTGAASGTAHAPGDGVADDENIDTSSMTITGDGVPDYYQSLYPNLFSGSGPALINEYGTPSRTATYQTMAFPYVFPGAYSKPDSFGGAATGSGWINSVDPSAFTSALAQLLSLNHAPLDLGDTLPVPGSSQTWWGFPTWREMVAPSWVDPGFPVAAGTTAGPIQPNFLQPLDPSVVPPTITTTSANFLPPMTSPTRPIEPANTDRLGATTLAPTPLWFNAWEDDLVMTGVRSFDVKAYDNSFPGYVDLGWGDDLRLYQQYTAYSVTPAYTAPTTPPYAAPSAPPPYPTSWPITFTWPPSPIGSSVYDLYGQTFAHEGRMPPLTGDHRLDAQYPSPFYPSTIPYPAFTSYTGNIGDDGATVIRLRRVWDTWSTTYTKAPARGFNPQTKLPVGPPFGPPIYPSYPPPYPAPMRGLQIQIRVVDPRNERIKMITIRQDFSDKL